MTKNAINLTANIVAVGTLILVMAVMAFSAIHPIPVDNRELFSNLSTMLYTQFSMVVSFFFGASVGGSKKDDTISAMAATANAAQTIPQNNPTV